MSAFLISQAIEVRPAKAEILPDERKRLTRFVSWKQNSELPLQLTYSYGDADVFTNPPTGWEGLRLIDAQSDYSLANNGAGNDPITRLTYEQISNTGLTQVGGTETTVLEDGRVSKTLTYIQFSDVSYTPTAAGSAGSGGFLLSEVANDNGSVRTIRRTYVESGLLAQVDETKNNGKLLIRTLTYAVTTPPTPSGYTLISENRRGPDGYEILTYTFAKGDGEISLDDSVKNDGKLLLRTIRHLTAPGGSNPISPPSGYVSIGTSLQEADGYRIWTASFAKGDGEISRDETYRQSVDQGSTGLTFITIRHLTASTVGTNPVSKPSGFILSGVDRNDQDGYRIWTASYAKGTGTVITDVTGRSDGSLVYIVTTLSATATTPSNPSGGTAYLTDLTNALGDGFYTNRATYIKLPATDTFKRQVSFQNPGAASFGSGTQLTLQPPCTQTLLADIEVSYGVTQISDTPFTVTAYAAFFDSYVPYLNPGVSPTPGVAPSDTRTVAPVASSKGLNGYLSGATGITDTNDYYNGVFCQRYDATLLSSIPSSGPSGSTVIGVDNDVYLTATNGVVVYRRTKTSYTF